MHMLAAPLAERQKMRVRAFRHYGLVHQPCPPFGFEAVNVPACRQFPCAFVSAALEAHFIDRQGRALRRGGRFFLAHFDRLTVKMKAIFRHVVMLFIVGDNIQEQPPKFLERRLRAALVLQLVQSNLRQ